MSPPIRVVVAEADNILAAVLGARLVDDEFSVVKVGEPIDNLLDVAREAAAQVLLIGPTVPRVPLVAEIPHLLADGCRTLVVSDALDEPTFALLLAGASGFLLVDDASPEGVAHAVRSVAMGAPALHPLVVQAVLERWRSARAGDPASEATADAESHGALPTLTKREREVLAGLREGLTNRLLAGRLGVAEKTVEAHKSRLYAKLGARNQAHAVRIAAQRGLG